MLNSNLIDNNLNFILAAPSQISKTLGQRIKQQRLLLNLQQQELALKANVSVGTLKNIENKGQCSLIHFIKIISALGLIEQIQSLFVPQPTSLKQLEEIELILKASTPKRARHKNKGPR